MRLFLIILTVLFVVNFSVLLEAEQVLIWDNDNGSHYTDENQETVDCEVGLEQALQANNIDYTTMQSLPDDLSDYQIIFVELGLYCVG